MKKAIKKIIAREGLILIGIVVIGLAALILGTRFQNEAVRMTSYFFIFFGYIVYRLICFVIWAFKILIEK